MLKVLFWSFPSSRWMCLKRLCELHLPRFGIRVFLLLRYRRSTVPYSVIFGTISRGCPARDFLHPPPGGRAPTPLYPSAGTSGMTGVKPRTTVAAVGGANPSSPHDMGIPPSFPTFRAHTSDTSLPQYASPTFHHGPHTEAQSTFHTGTHTEAAIIHN